MILRLLRWGLLLIISILLLAWWCDHHVHRTTRALVVDSMGALPTNDVALVLGTSHRARSGRPNLYFKHRMEAAAELYHAGKVKHLLLSGDNSTMQYNEPWTMRKALIAAGVDSSHITLDYAGFRTLDSVVRAREVFGQQRFTVVSQRFHNERAVYIARRLGIDAVGYNAKDVGGATGLRNKTRERLARVKLFLDLLVGKTPKFLGEPVEIPV
jgi:SanA protein